MNIIYNITDLNSISKTILSKSSCNVYCFYGNLGAGKTTLIRAILEHLGADIPAKSPTFSIVDEYELPNHKKAYHLDCYRLESEEEAYDMGLEECFMKDAWVFVEWPDKIASLLPVHRLEISMESKGPDQRELHILEVMA